VAELVSAQMKVNLKKENSYFLLVGPEMRADFNGLKKKRKKFRLKIEEDCAITSIIIN